MILQVFHVESNIEIYRFHLAHFVIFKTRSYNTRIVLLNGSNEKKKKNYTLFNIWVKTLHEATSCISRNETRDSFFFYLKTLFAAFLQFPTRRFYKRERGKRTLQIAPELHFIIFFPYYYESHNCHCCYNL